jgi:hypothetical protein
VGRADQQRLLDERDPVDYIVGANVERRHLTTGQRAMARAMALRVQGRRRDRRGVDLTGDSVSKATWHKTMAQAGIVLDETPNAARMAGPAGDALRRRSRRSREVGATLSRIC